MKQSLRTLIFLLLFTFAPSSYAKSISALYALYFNEDIPQDTIEKISAHGRNHGIIVIDESDVETASNKPALLYRWESTQNFKPISKSGRRYLSVGINDADIDAMNKAPKVLVLTSQIPFNKSFVKNYKSTEQLLHVAAMSTGAYIWDESLRLCYSRDSWSSNKINSWQSNIPDMSNQINMHAYRDNQLIRIVTLGMDKFFLPDFAVEDLPQGHTRSMGTLINTMAQHFIEGSVPDNNERLLVNIDNIKHKTVRNRIKQSSFKNAKTSNTIQLKETTPQEGDNDNFLYTINYKDIAGNSVQEKQSILLSNVFGSEDNVEMVAEGNLLLLRASRNARAQILKHKQAFAKGLDTNQRLLLKKLFSENGQNEYMWVELTAWKNGSIHGILMNQPNFISNLKAGANVEFPESEIYDYIWYKPDDTVEGNETGKIIDKLSKGK